MRNHLNKYYEMGLNIIKSSLWRLSSKWQQENGQNRYLKLKNKQERLLVIPLGYFWSCNFNWFSADWVILYFVRADLFCWLFSRYKIYIYLVKRITLKIMIIALSDTNKFVSKKIILVFFYYISNVTQKLKWTSNWIHHHTASLIITKQIGIHSL